MKRLLFFISLVFTASSLFANGPNQQNSEIEKYFNAWKDFLTQYDEILENYEASSPKAQAMEKKVLFSYKNMHEAFSALYVRSSRMYKNQLDSGVKKGAPMVKDLESRIEILKTIGRRMKPSLDIDQQRELLQWMTENNFPQKIDEIPVGNNKPGDRLVKTVNGVEFAFRWCPPGTFMMGSPESEKGRRDEEVQHSVTLTKGFWMMETEVTLGMFKTFVNETGYESRGEQPWYHDGNKWKTNSSISWRNPWFRQDDKHPVVCISWFDAVEFCKWLSKKTGQIIQLPAEAQWEYACRAGSTGAYAGKLNEIAWYNINGNHTHAVGGKKSNAWGLYDMHGNVYEWCQDWFGVYPSGNVTDPVGSPSGSKRIARGGCWQYNAGNCRSAFRQDVTSSGTRGRDIGFRCIMITED